MNRSSWLLLPLLSYLGSCSSDSTEGSTNAASNSTAVNGASGGASSSDGSTASSGAGAQTTTSATNTNTSSATLGAGGSGGGTNDTNSTSMGGASMGGASAGGSSVGGSSTGGAAQGGASGAGGGGGSGGGGAAASICPGGPYDAPLPDNPMADEVCSGMTFTEGPVWIGSTLYFSDFQINDTGGNFLGDIVEYTPGGSCSVWLAGTGTNGLAIGPDGNILGANHTTQTLTSYDLTSKEGSVLVDGYMGSSFSSPNDVAVRSDGNVYFTDPAYQVGNRNEELPQSVYRRAPDGELSVVEVLDDRRPNGVSLSPDESLLYVAASSPAEILVYDVDSTGATSASGTLVGSGSDGMAVDCAGNLYLTTGGVQVYSADGESLGSIGVSGSTTNVAFGGPQRRTLFITAGASLYAIELNVPGFPY